MKPANKVTVRELDSVELLDGCVDLERSVFDMPEIEISPVRHFIVTMHAGGFTLGAFDGPRLIGFSLSVPAFLDGRKAFYSHMTGVEPGYQGHGIGALLKHGQREECLRRGVGIVKWTFQPEKSLNAYFNLEKLGAEVRDYMINFYGTDYPAPGAGGERPPIRSDRLFAVWRLNTAKSKALARGENYSEPEEPAASIAGIADWNELLRRDRAAAAREQDRLCSEFREAFSRKLVCRGFRRGDPPEYLFYEA